jgi:hypothetical protein
MLNSTSVRVINILCLLAAIFLILLLPQKKEIWYDESVSMMCSNGLSGRDPARLADKKIINSVEFHAMNTPGNVFAATVDDNANSFLYNMGLHWFLETSGNSIAAYMMFSKLCGIATLLAIFLLTVTLAGRSLFTALAIVLMATDQVFVGMSHEVRAYALGIAFVCLAGVFYFRFINGRQRTYNLLLVGLFLAAAILSHFLSVYIVAFFVLSLLFTMGAKLFRPANVLAMLVSVALIGLFFYYAYPGLYIMKERSAEIKQTTMDQAFSVATVLTSTLRFIALNFRMVFPVFVNKLPVVLLSCVGIGALYFFALRQAADATIRRNLHLLFGLGLSSSIVLAVLCLKSGHYAALYYRYHSFSIPFAILFVAYAVYVLFRGGKWHIGINLGVLAIVVVPVSLLFISGLRSAATPMKYNHFAIARDLVAKKVTVIEVPGWRDAMLIHCVLPRNYKIDYVRNDLGPYFTLHYAGKDERIPVLESKH